MTEYDLIGNMRRKALEGEFDPHMFTKLTVKQLHLFTVKLNLIRDASRSPEKRDKLFAAAAALQSILPFLQAGDFDTAIRNSDRSAMLFADVELAQESVACVLSESTDAGRAFWLVGSGNNGGVDVSSVVKSPKE